MKPLRATAAHMSADLKHCHASLYLCRLLPLILAALAVLAPGARAAVTPIPLTACGRITQPGHYVLGANLVTSSGDCIVIAVDDVILDLNSAHITSTSDPKSGAGIHILKSAKAEPEEPVFIEGGCGLFGTTLIGGISGFAAGIEDEADGVFVDCIVVGGNIDGLLIKGAKGSRFANVFVGAINEELGNVTLPPNVNGVHIVGGANNTVADFQMGISDNSSNYGVLVEHSRGSRISGGGIFFNGKDGVSIVDSPDTQVDNCTITNNGLNGVLVRDSAGTRIDDDSISSNAGDGVSIEDSSGAEVGNNTISQNSGNGIAVHSSNNSLIHDGVTQGNGNYGVWIDSSSNNQIRDVNAQINNIGIYVGCNPAFSGAPGICAPKPPSEGTVIYGVFSTGIVIDLGDEHSLITNNRSSSAIDENSNCDDNDWFSNFIGTANQACVH